MMMKMFIPFKSNTKSILSLSIVCGLVLSAINIYESTKQGLIPPVVPPVVPGGGNGNMNSDNNSFNNKREGIMTHYDQMNNNNINNKRNLLLHHHQTPSVSSSSSSSSSNTTTTNSNNVASATTTTNAATTTTTATKKDNYHHHHQPVKTNNNNNNNNNNNANKRLISKSSSLTAATTKTTMTATTKDNHQQHVNSNNNNNNNVVVSSSMMMKDNNNNDNNIEDSNDNNEELFNFMGYDGYPRVVLAGGCAGSTATVDFMIKILEAHNFKLGGHEYEIMKPEKNWQYWYAEQRLLKSNKISARTPKHIYYQMVIVDAIRYLNNEDYKNNSTMLFKLDTPNFRYKPYIQNQFYYNSPAEGGLNVKFSHMYRGNPLDELICTIRDCFFNPHKTNDLGYPVFATNGTKSIHFCFQRRFHPEIKIKAYLNPNKLLDELESRMKHTLKLKNEFINITSPGTSQSNEDIFAFEYSSSKKIFDMSVIAWSNMLRSLLTTTNPITGEIIDLLNKTIISDTLRPYQNTIKQKPHSAIIYNIDEITSILKGTEYERFLRQ